MKRLMLVCLIVLAVALPAQAIDKVRIGILPQQEAAKTFKMFGPIAEHLTKETGVKFEIATAPTFEAFMDRVKKDEFDIIYLNSYLYAVAHNTAGYEAFVKVKQDGLTKFRGVVVVRADSPIKSLKDLNGKTIVFADDTSLAGYLLQKAYFLDRGFDLVRQATVKFAGKHDAALTQVYNGAADAAGVREPAVAQMKDKLDLSQLRVLFETDWMPQLPFAASKRMDPDLLVKAKAALLGLDTTTDAGKAILQPAAFEGFEAATDKDYDTVREFATRLSLPLQ